jgi:hypothetical protein
MELFDKSKSNKIDTLKPISVTIHGCETIKLL